MMMSPSSMSDMKPCIDHITSKDLPAIKDWKVGQKYILEVNVTLSELSQDPNDKTAFEADFTIDKVKNSGSQSTADKLAKKFN